MFTSVRASAAISLNCCSARQRFLGVEKREAWRWCRPNWRRNSIAYYTAGQAYKSTHLPADTASTEESAENAMACTRPLCRSRRPMEPYVARFQRRTTPSTSPVARIPFGENDRWSTGPLSPRKPPMYLLVAVSHKRTRPPSGVAKRWSLGEKARLTCGPTWASRGEPTGLRDSTSHSRTMPSCPLDASRRPVWGKTADKAGPLCASSGGPFIVRVSVSQNRTTPSRPQQARRPPFGETATDTTGHLCDSRETYFRFQPKSVYSPSPGCFHTHSRGVPSRATVARGLATEESASDTRGVECSARQKSLESVRLKAYTEPSPCPSTSRSSSSGKAITVTWA